MGIADLGDSGPTPNSLRRIWTIASIDWRKNSADVWTNFSIRLRSRCRCSVRYRRHPLLPIVELHINKCSLFQRRVEFLGHVLSLSGVEMQAAKVEAVQRWPVPRNVTDERTFLGFCSYYHRFIADFATIAAPMYELQRKNVRFH